MQSLVVQFTHRRERRTLVYTYIGQILNDDLSKYHQGNMSYTQITELLVNVASSGDFWTVNEENHETIINQRIN